MKMSKKIFAAVLALVMLFALTACGSTTAEETAAEDAVVEVVEETPAPIAAAIYYFAYVDIYGDTSRVSVRLNEDGSFDIMTLGAIGVATASGTEWADNGDGSFSTGATDEVLDVDFFGADGSVTWKLLDEENNVVPVNYVEPTEFEERPSASEEMANLPDNMYLYKETAFLPTDWTLEVLDDGTYKLSETNVVVGLQEYGGEIISQEGNILTCGPLIGNKPGVANWAAAAEGFVLALGEGSFEPIG